MGKRPAAVGQVAGPTTTFPVPFGASVSFNAYGGRFVCMTASYAYLVGTESVSNILGWADVGTVSSSSTAGDIFPVNFSKEAVYEMPLTTSYTETNLKARIGLCADVEVATGVQYVDANSATCNQVRIVGYRYYGPANGEQTVYVQRVEGVMGSLSYTGVA
jgi:hypothetical protein